jgi:hypothetical protein
MALPNTGGTPWLLITTKRWSFMLYFMRTN